MPAYTEDPYSQPRLSADRVQPSTPQGQAMGGGIVVKGMDQLRAEEQAQADQTASIAEKIKDQLAGHVDNCFQRAQRARKEANVDGISLDEMFLDCMRRRRGEYSPQKLAQLREQGSTIIYDLTTQVKCGHFESWFDEIYQQEKLFTCEPSAEPELPENMVQHIIQRAVEAVQQDIMAGNQPMTPSEIYSYAEDMAGKMRGVVSEEAREKANRMKLRIQEWIDEGDFMHAFIQFRSDLATFGTGIIEGPIFQHEFKLTWKGTTPIRALKIVPKFIAVSPMDFFPSPGITDTNQGGWMIKRESYDARKLRAMLDVPGVKKPVLMELLKDFGASGYQLNVDTDYERRKLTDKSTSKADDDIIEGLKFDGDITGQMLLDWSPTLALDGIQADQTYNVCVHTIASRAWKVTFNYEPLGKSRYHKAVYEPIPGSFWGRGIPWKGRDIQDRINGALRSLCDNLALSAGPQAVIDLFHLPPGASVKQVYPRKIWLTESKPGQPADKAVQFFKVESNAQELINIIESGRNEMDERTGLPAYQFGNQEAARAGISTLGGLNLMMGASLRTIKRIVAGVDRDVVNPLIESIFTAIMLYDPDQSIKGDVNIVVRGAMGVMMREQRAAQLAGWLAELKTNEVLLMACGRQRVVNAARLLAEASGLPASELVPSDQEVRAQMRAEAQAVVMQANMATQAQAQQPPAQAMTAERQAQQAQQYQQAQQGVSQNAT